MRPSQGPSLRDAIPAALRNLLSGWSKLPGRVAPHDRSAPGRMRHIDAHGDPSQRSGTAVATPGLQDPIA